MPRVLVVGASRGIGLAFATQYARDGWTVLATHRAPADAARLRAIGAEPIALDVTDAVSCAALPFVPGDTVDLVIINAGIHGPPGIRIEHPPTSDDFDAVMRTNVLGPMQVTAALAAPLVAAAGTLAFVSSRMGSISEASTADSLLYRASKAALGMVTKMAHIELAARGVRVIALHPGWVRTDLGGANAPLDADDSVRGMRRVLADRKCFPGGGFFDYQGHPVAW